MFGVKNFFYADPDLWVYQLMEAGKGFIRLGGYWVSVIVKLQSPIMSLHPPLEISRQKTCLIVIYARFFLSAQEIRSNSILFRLMCEGGRAACKQTQDIFCFQNLFYVPERSSMHLSVSCWFLISSGWGRVGRSSAVMLFYRSSKNSCHIDVKFMSRLYKFRPNQT
jgi:hypothetical protein